MLDCGPPRIYHKLMEKTFRSKHLHKGKILNLRLDEVKLPNGNSALREIIEHDGAAAAVPILEDGSFLLVKQYRKAVEEFLLEIPAGKIDKNESPVDCARRELEEETGYKAGVLSEILDFYPSPGYSSEKIKIFKAERLTKSSTRPDNDEFIEVVRIGKNEVLDHISKGKIKDGKTIAGICSLLIP